MSNLSKELVEMQILLRKHKVPQRSIDKIINRERNMQDRIDKAIEYIEQVNKDKDQVPYLIEGETLKLLDILRGEDNDSKRNV